MANIQTFLQNILSARYGKDVRQSIHDAIEEVDRVADTAHGSATEAAEIAVDSATEAEQYRTEAKQYRDEAVAVAGVEFATTEKAGLVKPDGETILIDPDGTIHSVGGSGGGGTVNYEELENKPSINGTELSGNKTLDDLGIASKTKVEALEKELEKTTYKVDTVIAHTDLGITETASGEEIHLVDSAESDDVIEFHLFGNIEQNTTSGKNLLENKGTAQEISGVKIVLNDDKSVTVNGTTTEEVAFILSNADEQLRQRLLNNEIYLSGCPKGGSLSSYWLQIYSNDGKLWQDIGNGASSTFTNESGAFNVAIRMKSGVKVENLTFYPMIRLASITDDTYEPYTNGASPNPQFPQPIEVSGESYNLIPYPYYETTHEDNGITFTDNGDGTITANGTATATAQCVLHHRNATSNVTYEKGDYILTGCPSGGGVSKYKINYSTSDNSITGAEIGSGATITVTNESVYFGFFVTIESGVTVENLVFKPMIRKASVKNDRYMPYGKGSVEVKSIGKNLLSYPYLQTTRTMNGVTFTDNGDGSITMNGTASALTFYYLKGNGTDESGFKLGGKYILSTENYHSSQSYLRVGTSGSAYTDCTSEKEVEFPANSDIYVCIRIGKGEVLNNVTFYPMIRSAEIKDGEYQPYKEALSTIQTPNGLAGIKVSSGGNYTDSNGQQWICDEVVKFADGSGAFVQRIDKHRVTSNEELIFNATEGQRRFSIRSNGEDWISKSIGTSQNAMSSHFYWKTGNAGNHGRFYVSTTWCVFPDNDSYWADLETFKLWLDANEVYIHYILAEPIETPLTAEQLADIETFYPVTNISNDFDCGMSVKYNCDSKNYIDKKIAEMFSAMNN